ncbi:heat shock protein HslJ [Fluviicoccus keumensis]|uniref:Heat shock protein HslJ n=1 Tax=Fluviicoccus keumensis TaxID=1435465 RepID=A0A4Q7ZB98_9GAMM|nr:META domain-containing protein [Fluviicoccus keumensis]RZU47882.1 heat shock protein HslJ [Fluviicoccus keumensis]
MTGSQPVCRLMALLAMTAATLSGCAVFEGGSYGPQTPTAVVTGDLTFQERVTLPPDSVAMVDLTSGGDSRVLAEQRLNLDERQLPVSFSLKLPAANYVRGVDYVLRASVLQKGRTLWVSEPMDVRADHTVQEVGQVMLHPFRQSEFNAKLVCGDHSALVGLVQNEDQDLMRLTLDDRQFDLRPSVSASGSRYVALGLPATEVWLKGDKALVTVRNQIWPDCDVVNDNAAAPKSPLMGDMWVVDDIDGEMIDSSRATLTFQEDGRLNGHASCNVFNTTYTQPSAGALTIAKGAATMMACSPELMEQEQRFLEILQGVQTFEIDETGELVLTDGEDRQIVAHR